MTKRALITGITGQDGRTFRSFSCRKGTKCMGSNAEVPSSIRAHRPPVSGSSRARLRWEREPAIQAALRGPDGFLEPDRIIQEVRPDEIYNLAAQSHVKVSFEEPEYTANSDASGRCGCWKRCASGTRGDDALLPGVDERTLRQGAGDAAEETTPFYPRSPYARRSSTPTGSR
jgi:GDPmannose 4,6-dehydratase